MKKLKRAKRKIAKDKAPKSLVGFVLSGSLHDVVFVLHNGVKIIAWPVRQLAHEIHKLIHVHPKLKAFEGHAFICAALGFVFLAVSFVIEKYYTGPLWNATVEVVRAAGAAPVWESMSKITKIAEFIEKDT